MQDKLKEVLEIALKLGAEYADIRWVSRKTQYLKLENARLQDCGQTDDSGVGLRVLVEGTWGFTSTNTYTKFELHKLARHAVKAARASALTKKTPVSLSPLKPVKASYHTPVRKDPFKISLEAKLGLLEAACKAMMLGPCLKSAGAQMKFIQEEKLFLSSEGSCIRQTLVHSGAKLQALAKMGEECRRRTYPGAGGGWAAAGYEFIESLNLVEAAAMLAKEVMALLQAPSCPTKFTDIVLGGNQLAFQLHESCGHVFELDRILGKEVSLAGGSFLNIDEAGKFTYGSPQVNITADAELPGGLGSFGFDDEGVPAQAFPLVREGIVENFLTSRQTAFEIQQSSNGCMRAAGWEHLPLIRMTNINLEPGDWSLEEIIKDTQEGFFLDYNAGYSIDDQRLNFKFGTEVAYEIKDGELGKLYKNPAYSGITTEFWKACDAVAGKKEWQLHPIPNCGKGEPLQIVGVSHGAAPARFRQVKVG
jgi:TldD protein